MGHNSKGANEDEEQNTSQFKYNFKTTYCPLFCLAEPPDEYFNILARRPLDHSWLNITSSATSLDRILEEIERNANEITSEPAPLPFLGSSFDEIDEFYEEKLRPPRQYTGSINFCHFVYLLVDQTCLRKDWSAFNPEGTIIPPSLNPEDWTIWLCSDAPDYDETERQVTLKMLRFPLSGVMNQVTVCETLINTPSEASNFAWAEVEKDSETKQSPTGLIMRPPPFMVYEGLSEDGDSKLYRVASRYEARMNKRRGLMMAEEWKRQTGEPPGLREPFVEGGGSNPWAADTEVLVSGRVMGTLPAWDEEYVRKNRAARGDVTG
ncbi:uncharacterized protein KY384_007403 [Bacidia gigantensis]|uniref:uncharacterized protein n=1 Tax=Bacidia gigantensis TaxID=2732470 RepID=UPI001D05C215|nr:uncharacterized protein KY384_007403 [Bacidia gigantensis]KAG8528485.1 hypothetical protein KY384_007403 [Bacidia gigantensis]